MSKMDELVDRLAQDALDLEEKTGDETMVKQVSDALGSSSPTMEEAFLTAVRIRRAERRARRLIETLKKATVPKPAPAPDAPGGGAPGGGAPGTSGS